VQGKNSHLDIEDAHCFYSQALNRLDLGHSFCGIDPLSRSGAAAFRYYASLDHDNNTNTDRDV